MSDYLFKSHCRALEEREFAGVFRLLRKAFGPKPRMILQKSLAVAGAKPKASVRKPVKPPKPALVVMRQPVLSDRQLAVFLGDATVRGLLSGSLALQVQKDVDAGGRMPAEVRATLLHAYGGRSGK